VNPEQNTDLLFKLLRCVNCLSYKNQLYCIYEIACKLTYNVDFADDVAKSANGRTNPTPPGSNSIELKLKMDIIQGPNTRVWLVEDFHVHETDNCRG